MRLVPAAILTLSLLAGPALAQQGEQKLKSLIGKKRRAPSSPAPPEGALQTKEEPAAPDFSGSPAVIEADRALLRGLELAFEPAPREIRIIAVEDLALLQDPRALNALAHLILDPDAEVALAAVRSVGHFVHPRAEEILGNVVRHPSLSTDLKVAAIHAIPFQNTASSQQLLVELADSTRYAPPVRRAAKEVLDAAAGAQRR